MRMVGEVLVGWGRAEVPRLLGGLADGAPRSDWLISGLRTHFVSTRGTDRMQREQGAGGVRVVDGRGGVMSFVRVGFGGGRFGDRVGWLSGGGRFDSLTSLVLTGG